MNHIQCINTSYIRSSRSIETVIVSNKNSQKAFFIYNYEGTSFRVFEDSTDLIHFFQDKIKAPIEFDTEINLDNYLSKVQLHS